MFIKYLPALMMLLAGIIALITSMVKKIELLLSMEILLAVMVIFFILGKIGQKIIVKILIKVKEEEKAKAEKEKEEEERRKEEEKARSKER